MIKERIKTTVCYEWYDVIRERCITIYYSLLPRKYVISKRYKKTFGKELDWINPHDLNEKINWLKLNTETDKWTELSDKYRVRDYVKDKGLKDILVPLYGMWIKPDDIDFDTLPKSFVLKTNHGSGDIIIVNDKSKIDPAQIRRRLNKELKRRFGLKEGEPHYLNIKPCVIAEKLLKQTNDSWTSSIVDYKFWCINGEPMYIFVCYNRSKEGAFVETHDINWGYHPEKSVFTQHYKDGKGIVPKPKCLDEMVDIARILAQGFPQVRIDLYEIEGKVYFGEMTFTSMGGFMEYFTQDFLNELGELIKIQ